MFVSIIVIENKAGEVLIKEDSEGNISLPATTKKNIDIRNGNNYEVLEEPSFYAIYRFCKNNFHQEVKIKDFLGFYFNFQSGKNSFDVSMYVGNIESDINVKGYKFVNEEYLEEKVEYIDELSYEALNNYFINNIYNRNKNLEDFIDRKIYNIENFYLNIIKNIKMTLSTIYYESKIEIKYSNISEFVEPVGIPGIKNIEGKLLFLLIRNHWKELYGDMAISKILFYLDGRSDLPIGSINKINKSLDFILNNINELKNNLEQNKIEFDLVEEFYQNMKNIEQLEIEKNIYEFEHHHTVGISKGSFINKNPLTIEEVKSEIYTALHQIKDFYDLEIDEELEHEKEEFEEDGLQIMYEKIKERNLSQKRKNAFKEFFDEEEANEIIRSVFEKKDSEETEVKAEEEFILGSEESGYQDNEYEIIEDKNTEEENTGSENETLEEIENLEHHSKKSVNETADNIEELDNTKLNESEEVISQENIKEESEEPNEELEDQENHTLSNTESEPKKEDTVDMSQDIVEEELDNIEKTQDIDNKQK